MVRIRLWKGVVGREAYYLVSQDGYVRSLDRLIKPAHDRPTYALQGRVLRGCVSKRTGGYVWVTLYQPRRSHPVHCLVATAFIGPAPSPIHEVNHIDGDPSHNHVSNLEWVTPSEQANHAIRIGLRRTFVCHGRSYKNRNAR